MLNLLPKRGQKTGDPPAEVPQSALEPALQGTATGRGSGRGAGPAQRGRPRPQGQGHTVGAVDSRAAAVPWGAAGGTAQAGGRTRRVTPARAGPRAGRRPRELLAGAGAARGRRQVRGAPGELSGTLAPAGPHDARNSVGGRGARCGLGRRGRAVWEAGFRPAPPPGPLKVKGEVCSSEDGANLPVTPFTPHPGDPS